jgi:hypothetical protein
MEDVEVMNVTRMSSLAMDIAENRRSNVVK